MEAKAWVPHVLLIMGVLYLGQVSAYQYSSYEFDENCNGGLLFSNIGAIIIRMESESPSPINCTMSIQTGATRQIMAKFRRLEITENFGCRYSALDLYDGKVRDENRLTGPHGLCGYNLPSRTYFTEGNLLTIRFVSEFGNSGQTFELVLTDNTWDFSCNNNGFMCNDGRCIDEFLQCDSWPNCADGSDEFCGGGYYGQFFSPWVIGGFSVLGLLVLGLCLAVLTVSIRRCSRGSTREKYINIKG